MSILDFFLNLIGKRRNPGPRKYELTETLQVILPELAEHEGRSELEFTSDLLAAGLNEYNSRKKLLPIWATLSAREKQVARLIYEGLTNEKIVACLFLSRDTIKTHIRNILRKFGVKSKAELRHILGVLRFFHWI